MESGKYSGDAPDLASAHMEHVGPYTFALTFREVGGDRGPTLHIFGPVNGSREEILRFDCFANNPHYHLGWSYIDAPFVAIKHPQPLTWVLDRLSKDFGEFVLRAQADWDEYRAPPADIEAALGRISRHRLNNRYSTGGARTDDETCN